MRIFNINVYYELKRSSKRTIIFFIVLLSLFPYWLYAQLGTLSAVEQPIAPNAAALGKFVEMPVSNYSGLPDIKIPLYDFKAKSLSVPISLSYHASGIKVRDIPSTVGSGWALNAGGVIIRVVRGITDGNDLSNPGYYKAGIETMGWPGGTDFPDYREMYNVQSEYHNGNSKIDTEFDIFYFNFMGNSGRFTFNKYGEVVLLGASNLKIEYGAGFYITDGDGVVYRFNKLEYTPNSHISSVNCWYLTNISGPVKQESIDFKYKDYGNGIYRSSYGKYSRYQKVLYQDISPTDSYYDNHILNPVCSQEMSSMVIPNMIDNTGGVILDKIGFGSDTIKFYHDTSRADVYKIKLDSIKIFQGSNTINVIKLTYGYNTGGADPLVKKLLLSTVKVNDQSPYKFTYYEEYLGKKMASIYAKGEDFWGFYNGEDFPEKASGEFGPPRFRSLVYGQTDNGWNSSYRNPDYRYAQLGSLKMITYPTGGHTEFEYEGNDFTEGFTGGAPEDDLDIVLLLDSVRTNGILASSTPSIWNPNGIIKSKEIMIHHDQTVTVNSRIGLTNDISNLSNYNTYIYNGGDGYDSIVRLYKYNNSTGIFDLLEERSYNPVIGIGAPPNNSSFLTKRSAYGISTNNHTLYLTEGRYKVESEISAEAYGLSAQIDITNSFKYRKYAAGTGWDVFYKYNAGGIRIKKIKFISPVNGSSFEKTYEYTDGNKSSGWLETPFANVTSSMYWGEMRMGGALCPQICNFYNFYYDNVIPMGNAQGGVIGYSKVTEKMDDGRKTVIYYSSPQDVYNYNYMGYIPIIDRVIIDNSESRGLPIYKEYFNSSNQKIKTESHSFTTTKNNGVMNLYARLTDLSGGPCDMYWPFFNNFGQLWGSYHHIQNLVRPESDIVKYFNGTDSLTETTKHSYTAFSNYPKKTVRFSSSGDSTITNYKYIYDYGSFSTPITNPYAWNMLGMSTLHLISQPVETYVEKYFSGVPKVVHAQFASFKSNVYLPDTVFTLTNTAGISGFSPTAITGSVTTKDSRYKPKLFFDKFNKGNVVEQRKEGDVKEVLLWGYNHSQIVARVTSSDYNTVKSLVDTTIINNPSSDAALRTTLNNIRTSLASSNPKAQVTSYTYSPLKGMTSMTDARGETSYFEYDAYDKLKRQKNADGDIKENIWYHYKP